MNRRNPFIELQRDHQVLLAHATRLHQASRIGGAAAHAAARDYLAYWSNSVCYHLLEEERFVLPAAIDHALAGNIRVANDRMRHQSDWLRVAVIEPSLLRDALAEASGAIRHHVRMLEYEFFDNMMEHMGNKRAQWIEDKALPYRKEKRPTAIGDARSEPTFLPG